MKVEELKDGERDKGLNHHLWESRSPSPTPQPSGWDVCEKKRLLKERAAATAVSKEGSQISVRASSWSD